MASEMLTKIREELDALVKWEKENWTSDEVTPLPDGTGDIGICTCTARYLQERLGGQVVGFSYKDNPTASIAEVPGGHDFLIVDGRWIVDWWAQHYSGDSEQDVFDLESEDDVVIVAELYGDPVKWKPI